MKLNSHHLGIRSHLALILLLSGLAFAEFAQAQNRVLRSRSECNSMCFAHFKDPEQSPAQYVAKLAELRAAIAKETDASKLKILREKEKQELADYLDKLEQRCDNFCKYNPE